MYFAIDSLPAAQIAADWAALCETDAPNLRRFALVDTAFAAGNAPLRRRLDIESLHPVYIQPPLDGLIEHSPALLPLPAGRAEAHARVQRLAQACQGKPMLSFVASEHDAAAIINAWQPCLYPDCGDGERFLLRFADTRVIPALVGALTPAHWAQLGTPLVHWFAPDRSGALRELALEPVPNPAQDAAFALSAHELAALIDAGQADAVIAFLHQHATDLLPQTQRAACHALVDRVCRCAATYSIEAFPDVITLATAALLTDGQLLDDPRLPAALNAQGKSMTLADRLAPLLPEAAQVG